MANETGQFMVAAREAAQSGLAAGLTMHEAMDGFRLFWLREALGRYGNNQCATAEAERMHRNTMGRLLKRLGLRASGRRRNWRRREAERV